MSDSIRPPPHILSGTENKHDRTTTSIRIRRGDTCRQWNSKKGFRHSTISNYAQTDPPPRDSRVECPVEDSESEDEGYEGHDEREGSKGYSVRLNNFGVESASSNSVGSEEDNDSNAGFLI